MHYHVTTGRPCHCPFNPLPQITAGAYFDALKQRKKLQKPETQRLLNFLERRHVNDHTEKWTDWLLKEAKAGNIQHTPPPPGQPAAWHQHTLSHRYWAAAPNLPEGRRLAWDRLDPRKWQHWCDFLNSRHPLRQGFNPNTGDIHDLQDHVRQWDEDMGARQVNRNRNAGTELHQFPDGWTVRELGPDEVKDEGDAMGHCVGNYADEVRDGDLRVLSLRDRHGEPHVTTGIRYENGDNNGYDQGQIYQHYGKGNAEPKPEYNDRLRQYFETLPLDQRPLSEDYGSDYDYLTDIGDVEGHMRELGQRGPNGEVPLDHLGLPTEPVDWQRQPPNYDLDRIWDSMIRDGHGPYQYYHADEGENLFNFMKHYDKLGELGDHVENAEHDHSNKWSDNFFNWYDGPHYDDGYQAMPSPYGLKDDPDTAVEAYNKTHQDWNPQSEPLEELNEETGEYRDPVELAQQIHPDWHGWYEDHYNEKRDNDECEYMDDDPHWQQINHMMGMMQPYYNQDTNAYQNLPYQGQQQMNTRQAHRTHYNPMGMPCRCPWGHDFEHVGSVKTSAKIDWLKGRQDMQDDEGQKIIHYLEDNGYAENADKLLPWIVREWRKGRLGPAPQAGREHWLSYLDGRPGNARSYLSPTHLTDIQEILNEMKKHRQGLDVMQHPVHELMPKINDFKDFLTAKKREKYGEILHRFPDDWTIRRLRNKEEAKDEGDQMGHCVGSYGASIEDGNTMITSLRDQNNKPHATMELSGYGIHPEHGHPVPEHGMYVQQFYGKQDAPPLPEYANRMNEWLEQYGTQAPSNEPWWDDRYDVDGPENFRHFVGYASPYGDIPPEVGSYPEEDWREWHEPEDYNAAMADAEEWGREGPELYVGDPDYHSIIDSMIDPSDMRYYDSSRPTKPGVVTPERRYRPEWADFLTHHAEQLGHVGALREALLNHVEEGYDPEDHEQDPVALAYYNHIGGNIGLDDGQPWQQLYHPTVTPPPQVHPQQGMMFGQEGGQYRYPSETYVNLDNRQVTRQPFFPHEEYQRFTNVLKEVPPLYHRWVFSPETGQVELSANNDGHPAMVPYHEELAGRINRPNLAHGYAYTIPGGFRITDWDHKSVDDPYILAQVLAALRGRSQFRTTPEEAANGPDWEPAVHDFDRLHHGVPLPAED